MSLSKTLYPLLSTGSTREDPFQHDWKIVDWDVKNQNNKKKKELCPCNSMRALSDISSQ